MEAVILIGIQASGKSSFYQEYYSNTHMRINLDMLKTRHRENIFLNACIQAKQPFVIDNTNVLARERSKYIQLAKSAGFLVIGCFFDVALNDALRRNQQRSAPTLVPVAGVRGKYRNLERPRFEEGFDRLFTVTMGENPRFIVQEWQKPQN
jgi:predicted kinase